MSRSTDRRGFTRTDAALAVVGGAVGGVTLAVAAWVAYAEKWWAPRIAGDDDDDLADRSVAWVTALFGGDQEPTT